MRLILQLSFYLNVSLMGYELYNYQLPLTFAYTTLTKCQTQSVLVQFTATPADHLKLQIAVPVPHSSKECDIYSKQNTDDTF
jgi:hypothetical protein